MYVYYATYVHSTKVVCTHIPYHIPSYIYKYMCIFTHTHREIERERETLRLISSIKKKTRKREKKEGRMYVWMDGQKEGRTDEQMGPEDLMVTGE